MVKKGNKKVETSEYSGLMRKADSVSGFPTSSLSGDFAFNPSLMSNPEVIDVNPRTEEEIDTQKKMIKDLSDKFGKWLYQIKMNPQQIANNPIKSEGVKVDIIVPCYKAHKTLPRLLGNIISQTIVEDLEVTLVNDGGEEDYQDIINKFKEFVNIREVKIKENYGPGTARRIGYEYTGNPLVTWIDADDTFANSFALQILRSQILQEPVNMACMGTFIEEHMEVNQMVPHQGDTIWMFGKIYRRDFLDKYNIRMNDTRANEDNGFNMLVKFLCCNEVERIKFIGDPVYFWHSNPNSITRVNDCQYSYDQSFVGYTENMIWAIKEGEKRNPFNPAILYEKVAIMFNLYEYYIETVARDQRFIDQNWSSCKLFYKEVYDEVKHKIPDEVFKQAYNDVIRNAYMGNKLDGIIPCISIKDFLDKLDREVHGEESTGSTEVPLYMGTDSPEEMSNIVPEGFIREGGPISSAPTPQPVGTQRMG